jgi:hypothetical protein
MHPRVPAVSHRHAAGVRGTNGAARCTCTCGVSGAGRQDRQAGRFPLRGRCREGMADGDSDLTPGPSPKGEGGRAGGRARCFPYGDDVAETSDVLRNLKRGGWIGDLLHLLPEMTILEGVEDGGGWLCLVKITII